MPSPQSNKKESPELEIRDSFLAPWGLSGEELPMHILWSGSTERIEINLPAELDVIEIHNIDLEKRDTVTKNGKIQLSDDDLVTPGYLGFVLADENKYSEPAIEHNIEITFSTGGEQQSNIEKTTNIIRPQIRVQNAPDEIELTDDEIPDSIEIEMAYIGFGMAQVAVEAEAGGEFVSEGESILHDLLEAILETEVHKQDVDAMGPVPDEWEDDSDVEVPQEEIEGIVKEMSDLARSDEFTGDYESQELMEVAEVLEEAEKQSESDSDIAAVIYRFIETALLSSILNVVDRHPTENVSLDNPTTKIRTKARTTELEIKVRLRDSLENEYDPELVLIDVKDNRENEAGMFETEIETSWENYQVDPDEVFGDD